MFENGREKPTAEYLLRAGAIMRNMDAGVTLISELAYATALPKTTIIRTAAIMADERIIVGKLVGDDVSLSFLYRGPVPEQRS